MRLAHARMPTIGRLAVVVTAVAVAAPAADLDLGPEQLVPSGGTVIDVPGYSVPSVAEMTGDGLFDLIVGEGSYSAAAKVRIYPNVGTAAAPAFDGFGYAPSGGGDLTLSGGGCLGLAPRGFDWNADGLTDLIIGTTDGRVLFYENTGSAASPGFDTGSPVEAGPPGAGTPIDVGNRAVPSVRDWNADGHVDLIVGAYDGWIHVYLNAGAGPDGQPQLAHEQLARQGASYLTVPGSRSAPDFIDLDDDGLADLLVGNTNGQLLLYPNVGTAADPDFSGYTAVTSVGVAIDLPGLARSRPSVTDWNADGLPDVLIGADDGRVHLYPGVPEPVTATLLLCGAAAVMWRRRT